MDVILSLEGIEKAYQRGLFRKPVQALTGLDLEVRAGETYGFLGINGSGKTTTFKILLGLMRPDRGRGELLGFPIGNRNSRRRLGFLPELPAFYSHLTGGEVLRFARDLSSVPRDDVADRRALDELGVEMAYDRRIKRLSKGQLQRVGLAQAMVHEPEFLVLDEPMSGLDPLSRRLVKDCLRRQQSAGRTILLSTHVLADMESLVDRVGLLSGGQLLLCEPAEELLASTAREVRIHGSGNVDDTVLEGLPEGSEWLAESRSEPGCDWTLRLERPESFQVDASIRRIIRLGGRIDSVETVRDDLESVFVERLRKEASGCES